jgi:hypothetical protein
MRIKCGRNIHDRTVIAYMRLCGMSKIVNERSVNNCSCFIAILWILSINFFRLNKRALVSFGKKTACLFAVDILIMVE